LWVNCRSNAEDQPTIAAETYIILTMALCLGNPVVVGLVTVATYRMRRDGCAGLRGWVSGCEIEIQTMIRSISTLGVCLLLGGGALVETIQSRPALKDVFEDAFAIGTAVNNAIVSGNDPESRDLVLRHFASITADNAMKAGPINPRPGEFNFGPADAFVAFGEAHGMFIVGHTLVWHNQTPAWFFQDSAGQPLTNSVAHQQMLRNRLRTLEQQVNASDLPDDVKIKLQGYVSGCYGSLTSFNVLFADESDQFKGSGGE